ncbi:hypothetical protein [Vallicoccus soli]|uniref:GH26 domain-containing protein n=1 Tax=Vallicoccus soli TaxID=2339232 RepID=A0A3A3Z4M3_9ACTN|nr:hypothetical protein [Vallicoccus soli]RJK97888.1 hypothetical protein D5H78_02655 [Vallicoccus soli]
MNRSLRPSAGPAVEPRSSLSRRGFLSLSALGLAGAVAPGALAPAAAATATPRWPGHKPGKVYLGMSCPGEIALATTATGAVGTQRSFFGWDQVADEVRQIRTDHAAARLPWVSFKPPGGAAGWKALAAGTYDAQLRQRALAYAGTRKPVVVTFHHEPTNDSDDGAAFAAAWVRIHDVMKATTGLRNVAFAPIIGDWEFNPRNRSGHPEDYLTPAVLRRMAFLGVDCYQNASGDAFDVRLGRIVTWLGAHGAGGKMIGIGETGCTGSFSSRSAVDWWNASWTWASANPDKIGIVSYFNSGRNSKETVYWPLDESAAKLRAYRAALGSARTARAL